MTQQSSIPPACPYLHMLERVEFKDHDWPETGSILVCPIWKDVDRSTGSGFAFRPQDQALAERLRDIILRGDAYSSAIVEIDSNGHTYVSARNRFTMMELAEDLDTLDRICPITGADS